NEIAQRLIGPTDPALGNGGTGRKRGEKAPETRRLHDRVEIRALPVSLEHDITVPRHDQRTALLLPRIVRRCLERGDVELFGRRALAGRWRSIPSLDCRSWRVERLRQLAPVQRSVQPSVPVLRIPGDHQSSGDEECNRSPLEEPFQLISRLIWNGRTGDSTGPPGSLQLRRGEVGSRGLMGGCDGSGVGGGARGRARQWHTRATPNGGASSSRPQSPRTRALPDGPSNSILSDCRHMKTARRGAAGWVGKPRRE